jgi:transposase
MMGISWRTVGSIVERIVAERLDPHRFNGLRRIGVDEFSYRKRHRYITVVVDHDTRRVIWAKEGKSSDTLASFFGELGPDRAASIEHVTMDMAGSYIKAVTEHVPQAEIVFDRFHVQRLASDAVDAVRRAQWREFKGTDEGKAIKGARFPLLKNPWNLTVPERRRLRDVQRTNAPLYRAYLLKEMLAKALDYLQPKRARRMLDAWLAWACRSRLEPFVKLANTIREHKESILAYIKHRLTNGVVEGINNRTRMVARRAYGFHSSAALISMLHLCSGGIELQPPLP